MRRRGSQTRPVLPEQLMGRRESLTRPMVPNRLMGRRGGLVRPVVPAGVLVVRARRAVAVRRLAGRRSPVGSVVRLDVSRCPTRSSGTTLGPELVSDGAPGNLWVRRLIRGASWTKTSPEMTPGARGAGVLGSGGLLPRTT
jgi:hypothetical protein